MVNDPNTPDHAAPTSNPLTTPLPKQAKAVLGLIGVILTTLAAQLPDATWLITLNTVVGAALTYMAVFQTPNAKPNPE